MTTVDIVEFEDYIIELSEGNADLGRNIYGEYNSPDTYGHYLRWMEVRNGFKNYNREAHPRTA